MTAVLWVAAWIVIGAFAAPLIGRALRRLDR